ncbi:SDR family NAD(P)-dependent oxidoreductase [Paraburkholderia fynbosensis]|uniref:2,5-dichloro-2,5-cyclohexadiene-1,4-diol dehydrogenase n=1 Tax=Paraburkholderia fynbosensis TaxID=1200993 RepID=A0A6J5GTF4_9BURK|nr:SDR family NAD(P)-dependent oxidoreductase [Paraburkholderia fynbosensis]CAB3806590.1 2,5-dichloro-2,5-cyclohexadiene-1,4-diol dehydrogenase [Paraburkholderia fynbosensis]
MTLPSPYPAARLNMAGKICIVTGAASGIGRAIARQLAANGATVMIADITTGVFEGSEPTAALITRDGGHAHFIATDVGVTAQVEALVAHTVERFGRLDVLLNNACIRHARPLLGLDDAHWRRLLDLNLTGLLRCCRAAVWQMMQQAPKGDVRGRIVNLSSQHGMIEHSPGFASSLLSHFDNSL